MKTSAFSAGVVADANVLLSAALEKAALRIFSLQLQWTLLPSASVLPRATSNTSRPQGSAWPCVIRTMPTSCVGSLAFVTLWSNDSDLAGVGVDCYTTARLLKILSPLRLDKCLAP